MLEADDLARRLAEQGLTHAANDASSLAESLRRKGVISVGLLEIQDRAKRLVQSNEIIALNRVSRDELLRLQTGLRAREIALRVLALAEAGQAPYWYEFADPRFASAFELDPTLEADYVPTKLAVLVEDEGSDIVLSSFVEGRFFKRWGLEFNFDPRDKEKFGDVVSYETAGGKGIRHKVRETARPASKELVSIVLERLETMKSLAIPKPDQPSTAVSGNLPLHLPFSR